MVAGIPFLCPGRCKGEVRDSLCGEIAKVIEYCTFMPGEVIRHSNAYGDGGAGDGDYQWNLSSGRYKYSVKPRSALYIVDSGVVLLRRLKDVKILNK
jgi:hypothetical protein